MGVISELFSADQSTGGSASTLQQFLNGTIGRMFRTSSGETVTHGRALSLSTYYACLRRLHDDIGKMPWEYINKSSREPVQAKNLLAEPNSRMSGQVFLGLMVHWAASWPVAIAEIQRNGAGQPIALHPIHPSRVEIVAKEGRKVYRVSGDIENGQMQQVDFEQDEVWALFGMGPDEYQGYSTAQYGANTIGLGLAANDFASGYYKNGGGVNLAIKVPKNLSPEARDNLRESWLSKHGGARNTGKPALLDNQMEIERFDIPANEAQMLESRQFQVEEVCRWFGMPPVKIGHNQNVPFANHESINRQYVDETLMPWIVRIETESNRKLLTPAQRNINEYRGDVTGLLRGDTQARSTYYRTMIAAGVMTPNEARLKEMLPSFSNEAASQLYMQSAMATLDQIANGESNRSAPTPRGEPGRPTRDEAESMMRPLVQDAVARVATKHAKAIANHAKVKQKDPDKYASWLADFCKDQKRFLAQALGPVVEAMGIDSDAAWCAAEQAFSVSRETYDAETEAPEVLQMFLTEMEFPYASN